MFGVPFQSRLTRRRNAWMLHGLWVQGYGLILQTVYRFIETGIMVRNGSDHWRRLHWRDFVTRTDQALLPEENLTAFIEPDDHLRLDHNCSRRGFVILFRFSASAKPRKLCPPLYPWHFHIASTFQRNLRRSDRIRNAGDTTRTIGTMKTTRASVDIPICRVHSQKVSHC